MGLGAFSNALAYFDSTDSIRIVINVLIMTRT